MGITHAATKSPGDMGTADEWNADHLVSSGFEPRQAATLVVAAYDSESTERADYVCDGTADEVQINQAITALNGVGGKVLLLEGHYNIAASVVLDDDIVLEGQGFYTIIAATTEITMLYSNAKNRVQIKNLRIYGAGGSLQNHYGISISGGEDGAVINCMVDNVSSYQIMFGNHTNGRIINCISRDSTRLVTGIGIIASSCSNMMILGCIVEDNRAEGIRFVGVTHSIIKNCIVRGNGTYGLNIRLTSEDCVFSDNIVEGHSSHGIRLDNDTNRCIVANNRCKDNAGDEIIVEDADCDDNLVHGNHCLGVHANAYTDNGTNTTSADNVLA